MQDDVFSFLSAQAILALDLLDTPIVIVCAATRRAVWANRSALADIGADIGANIGARTPQRLGELEREALDPALTALIDLSMSALDADAPRQQSQPVLAPDGRTLAFVRRTEASMGGVRDAILIEIVRGGGWRSEPASDPLPVAVRQAEIPHERGVTGVQRRIIEIASHEFRTPLAVIDGAAQRIARRAGIDTPDRMIELAERIREFVGRLGSLLDDTVEQARGNFAEPECKPVPGRIQQVVEQMSRLFVDQIDIAIADEVHDLPEIGFDRFQIERALINLIENAIKYSDGRPSIRFTSAVTADQLQLYVRDRGIGITVEDRERVFDENARGRNVGERMGSGLGLFIVREIMRAHGGDITIEPQQEPGTTLKIVLPLRRPE